MPFRANVEKLRAAFLWLQAHNPYYFHIHWNESAAQAWSAEDVTVGTTQEEDLDQDQPLAIHHEDFEQRIQELETQSNSSECALPM